MPGPNGDFLLSNNAFAGYDTWFARKPNNAQLAAVAIYTQMVPAFQALLRREGGDLGRFYAAVKKLAALPKDERTAQLTLLAPQVAGDPPASGERKARERPMDETGGRTGL